MRLRFTKDQPRDEPAWWSDAAWVVHKIGAHIFAAACAIIAVVVFGVAVVITSR